jgi:hypothetical protein
MIHNVEYVEYTDKRAKRCQEQIKIKVEKYFMALSYMHDDFFLFSSFLNDLLIWKKKLSNLEEL